MRRIGTFFRGLVRKRRHTVFLAAILCLTLLGSGGLLYYRSLNSRMRRDDGYYFPGETVPEHTDEAASLPAADLAQVDAARLEQSLRGWAGDARVVPLEDRNVLNILLCGVDTQTGDARGGRSDAMLLVSINRRKRTVFLTSFLRDSCSYIDLSRDPGNPRAELGRVAAAYSLGGPATLMETLTADYKILVDDYVCVDFNSFPKLIDALGGVTLDVSRAEAGYINRTVPRMKGEFPWGQGVELTGLQALVYARVSQAPDEARAARQQRLILAILDSARNSSPGKILKTITRALRYVRTDLTEDDVDSLAKEAFIQGWLSYGVVQLRSPTLPGEEGPAAGLSADVNGQRMWVVDYPKEARRLQEAIYGYTNIEDGKGEDYIDSLFE